MPAEFDADQDTCRATIQVLQNAYMTLISGNKSLKVRYDRRWLEYHPGSAQALLTLINTIWAQCDDTEGLMNFNPAYRAGPRSPFFLRIGK